MSREDVRRSIGVPKGPAFDRSFHRAFKNLCDQKIIVPNGERSKHSTTWKLNEEIDLADDGRTISRETPIEEAPEQAPEEEEEPDESMI
jgi:hypothetical protein